jgi:hypothetical protein
MKRNIVLSVTLVFLGGLVFLIGYDIAHKGVNALSVFGILIVAFFAVTVVGALISREPEDVQRLLRDKADAPRPFWDDSDRI